MSPQTAKPGDLKWLLNDLVMRVPEARDAIVLSEDGLLMASSQGLGQSDAEHLAAVASGYHGLSRSAGHLFNGGTIRQTIVEMDAAFLFVTAAGRGACLAVISNAETDIGLIAYEMALLVQRVGASLSTSQRLVPTQTGTG
ncbi:MAG: roadblock/LC7 domain-containing protein [Micromonosporaceae bacterium]